MYIYVTTNIQNGKQYVGKCHKPVSKSKYYLGSGILLRQSLYNYGKEFFKKQILEHYSIYSYYPDLFVTFSNFSHMYGERPSKKS